METVSREQIALDSEVVSNPTSALRILFADDSASIRWVIQRYLEGLGHSVHVVDDGRQAVEAVRQRAFDVAILDLFMPSMDGGEAAAQIRKHAAATKQPVFIICATSHHVKNLGEQWDETLFDAVLSKPFDGEDLARILAELPHHLEA